MAEVLLTPELSAQFRKVAVTAGAAGEAAGAPNAFDVEHPDAILPFLFQSLAHVQPVLEIDRAPIRLDASLREARDFMGQRLGLAARRADRHDLFTSADPQTFLRRDLAAGQNDLHGAALSDQARQTHRSTVKQWNAPPAAIDAEIRVLLHDADIAPQRQFHAAGDRRPGDRGDHGLVKIETRWAERAARRRAAILGKIQMLQRPAATLQ